jgi:hypothetical protein
MSKSPPRIGPQLTTIFNPEAEKCLLDLGGNSARVATHRVEGQAEQGSLLSFCQRPVKTRHVTHRSRVQHLFPRLLLLLPLAPKRLDNLWRQIVQLHLATLPVLSSMPNGDEMMLAWSAVMPAT